METEPQNQNPEPPQEPTPAPASEQPREQSNPDSEKRPDRRGRSPLRERVAEFLGFRKRGGGGGGGGGGRNRKEIIINAESLEKRVAVLENGTLEELSIERTTDERLVGSVFKGRVKNLEHGLKAAFVDIGWAKNAFLHYWDIVPGTLDASFDPIEDMDGEAGGGGGGQSQAQQQQQPQQQQRRRPKERDQQQITPKEVEKMYPPGSEIIVQVTKGPMSTR